MKNIIFIMSFFATSIFCEDDKDQKLDSLITITNEIKDEVKKKSPIHNKKIGIEINPVMPLFDFEDSFLFTAGVQFFNWDRKAEISFPFQIFVGDENKYYSLDIHYRRFLGDLQKGFYLSGFTRSAFVDGEYLNNNFEIDTFSNLRIGLGAGLGYRIYSRGRLYWGFSFNIGRYFVYDEPEDNFITIFGIGDFSKQIFDVEFFKFGFSF